MLLEVRHVTQYHYDRPVRESVMEVWMQPQKAARQRLVSRQIADAPPTHGPREFRFVRRLDPALAPKLILS